MKRYAHDHNSQKKALDNDYENHFLGYKNMEEKESIFHDSFICNDGQISFASEGPLLTLHDLYKFAGRLSIGAG